MGHHGLTVYTASYALTGLIAFFFFLIPGVEFLEQILAGLITDLDDFILSLSGMFPVIDVSKIFYLAEAGAEVALFNAYPVSWTLFYRPEDAWSVALQIIPWLASGAIIGSLFPDNPKEGLIIGIGTILTNVMFMVTMFIIIPLALLPNIPMIGPAIIGVMNGMAQGFTDVPMGVSAVLTQLEGGGIFTAMVLFMSTLKSSEHASPESTSGANAALVMTSIFGGILCIPGFIVGLVNIGKNPGDRKAIAATLIGAMQLAIFVMVIFIFIPMPGP